MMKCLIVDYMYDDIETLIRDVGMEPDYRPLISRDEILGVISNYEGLIIRSKTRVDKELIDKATRLRFVARAGAGIDNLDEALLQQRSIAILNAPEGNRNAVGEHCMGLLLSLLHNIVKSDTEVRQGIWDREGNRGYELSGKTVGLIGYGFMGTSFAQKLKAFGCEVIFYDKYKLHASDGFARQATMEELFERVDVLSLHVPLTHETNGLVNEDYLSKFEKNIFFINTARGEVTKLSAIRYGLESGKIRGAALDVLENEKINKLSGEALDNFKYLINSNKTILTPHVAGWSFESYKMINTVLIDKIKQEINGNN